MKKLWIAIVFMGMTAISYNGLAQQSMSDKTPEQRAQMQTQMVTKALNLNEDQQKAVYAANLKATQDMMAARSSGDRSKMQTIDQEKDAAYKATLTDDQYKQYQQYKAEMKAKMQQRRQNMQQGSDMNQQPQ
jgi:hypothetical protein